MMNRREFLKIIGGLIATGAVSPAFAVGRKPYVRVGEVVNFIGHSPGGFIGGQIVHAIGEWDGVGYPVHLWNNCFGPARALERYYDFDLSDFQREVPPKFWHSQSNVARYPNVHTYVREQRFGETIAEAIRQMNSVCIRPSDWI